MKTSAVVFSMLLAASLFAACSSSDDDLLDGDVPKDLMSQKPLWNDSTLRIPYGSKYKTEKGTTWVWHDELGRVSSLMFFVPALMDIDVLNSSYTSIDQLNGVFYILTPDDELRLINNVEFEGKENNFNTSGLPSGFDYYQQYYKGLRVFGKGFTVNYYLTAFGKRLAYAIGQVQEGINLDISPKISESQAKSIYAAYLGDSVGNDWEAELMVREYCILKDGNLIPETRLIWHVKGSLYPEEEAKWIIFSSSRIVDIDKPLRYECEIDARTGRFLISSHSLANCFYL